MRFALAPWHMWGTTERVTVTNTAGLISQQLSKISYKRPETWTFFLGARLLTAPNTLPAIAVATVVFDIIIGIGRTNFVLGNQSSSVVSPGFVTLNFEWPALTSPNGQFKWVTEVPSPVLDDSAATPVTTLCDHFPAQDIQCSARVAVGGGGAPFTAEMEVTSYFAPRTHIRPEWLSEEGEQFRGEETGGS